MSKKAKENPKDELLETAKKRFEACSDYYAEEYRRGEEDVDFILGNQWPEAMRSQRELENRPCLTENRTLTFVHNVINQIRQTRPAISVVAVDDKADVETAKIHRGLIRNTEVRSGADNVYDTAAWNAITAGYGWIRVNTKYIDDETFDQEPELLRIVDFKSVMLDPNSKEMDGSDAEYGFVCVDMPKDDFEAQYPDADKSGWDKNKSTWNTEDSVRVCEYFYKEYEDKELVSGEQKRTVRVVKVKWCKLTENEILEKNDWIGKYIPLVPVYGDEAWQDNRRKCFSLISQSKDPQRRFNYWLTASAEIIALQPKAPFIGMTGQFATYARKWASANNSNHAYLEYDAVKMPDGSWNTNAPQRQMAPQGSPAMFQEMMAAADGIKATLGIYDASIGARSNETSGKAILARQNEGDNATFHFVDNLQTSIRHIGRILVDLNPKLLKEAQIKRIIGEDDKPQMVPLNQAVIKEKDGYRPIQQGETPSAFFDMNAGKYDVVVNVGASFATKRQETVQALQTIIQSSPETFQIFGDIFLKNLDISDAEVLAERFKRLNPQLNDEQDPQAAQMMKAQQMIQGMQQQMAQMDEALKQKRTKEGAEVQAEIALKQAEIEKTKAETTKIQADVAAAMATTGGVTPEHMQEIVRTIAALEAGVRDTAQAVNMMLSSMEGGETEPPESALPTETING